ncbi:hypothetical protein QPK87_18190 [Kamptonema cortianum]|nr:hypothetical protein [Geitlerinema splendidum]MDK3158487.1 hypothetical protein [Kamptonema cortianum]
MYLLSWNPEHQQIEASFGGCITKGEAEVFCEELDDLMKDKGSEKFDLILDYSTTNKIDAGAKQLLDAYRERAIQAGAHKVVYVTRSEEEADGFTLERIQSVLSGSEQYAPYRQVA